MDVSPLTLNRLSVYLRCLRQLQANDVKRVSSKELARRFQLSATLIRKDLAQFGEFGIRGVGYDVAQLARRLVTLLGLDRQHRILVVGVGNLGSALARHLASHRDTFVVVACCDNDPQKVGRRIGGIVIRASSDVARVVRETRAEIGILAVPAAAAQSNYEALVEAGIEGCSTSPRRPSSRAPACG